MEKTNNQVSSCTVITTPRERIMAIIQIVCDHFKVSVRDVLGESQFRSMVRPRHMIMFLLREHMNFSTKHIGNVLDRDHSTVVSALKKMRKQASTCPEMIAHLEEIRERIRMSGQLRST